MFFEASLQNLKRVRRFHYIYKHANRYFMLTVTRYTATWCGPCKQLAPVFEELSREINQASFQTIDVDMNRESAIEKGVSSVPTIILEKDGTQVYRFSGVLSKSVIAGIIRKYL